MKEERTVPSNAKVSIGPTCFRNEDLSIVNAASKIIGGRRIRRNSFSSKRKEKPDVLVKKPQTIPTNILAADPGNHLILYLSIKDLQNSEQPTTAKIASNLWSESFPLLLLSQWCL